MRGRARALRFVITFLALWGSLSFLSSRLLSFQEGLCRVNARALGVLFGVLGIPVRCEDRTIRFEGVSGVAPFLIVTECTSLFVSILFLSAVLAYPATARQKLFALAWGLPLLIVVNLARVLALGIVQVRFPRYFEFVHDYLWQASFIVVVVLMMWAWTESVARAGTGEGPGARPGTAPEGAGR